jgi:predicted O-methyltransferase YrrM
LGNLFFSIKAFFSYWLQKEDRYSIQSSFVFNRYSDLLNFIKKNRKGNPEIEGLRKNLLNDPNQIKVLDLGAGSKKIPLPTRRVSEITRYSTSNIKFSQLYEFFCLLTPAMYVVELGTCVGISTRYISKATRGTLFTFEGSEEIQKIAKKEPFPENTEFILGEIEQTLPELLGKIPQIDFALIDANHTYRGTMQSFFTMLPKVHSESILAIGDIHWSAEMEKAWLEIQSCPQVKLTMDFFECGIVFFDNPGLKSHLILDI